MGRIGGSPGVAASHFGLPYQVAVILSTWSDGSILRKLIQLTLWLSRIRLLLATLSQRLEDHRCSPTEAPALADRTRTIRIGYDLIAELRPTLLAAGLFNLELGSLTSGISVWRLG